MREQTTFMDILSMVIKRWWVLLCVMCVFGIVSFTISEYLLTPQYTSKGKLLVSSEIESSETNININTLNTSTRLVSTYIQIFKTKTFLKRIADLSQTNYTADQIGGMLSLSAVEETEVLEVKITCPSPTDAKILANLVLDNAQDEIDRIGQGGFVSVIDEATTPTEPSSPNVELFTVVGILLGAFAGVLLIFIIELLDTRIKSEDDLVSRYELPILGLIPTIEEMNK